MLLRRTLASTSQNKIWPLSDRVLVSKIKPAEKTIGGIVLPDSAQSKINKAKVVSVGPGRKAGDGTVIAMSVKVGDTVLLSESFNGTDVMVDGKEYTMYREDDILAILKD